MKLSKGRNRALLAAVAPVALVAAIAATSFTTSATGDVAADRGAMRQAMSLSSAFRDTAKVVLPSVVTITSTTKSPQPVQWQGNGDLGDLQERFKGTPFEKFFGDQPGAFPELGRGMPQPRRQGMGSGVIIGSSGTILTNNHVVAGASEVTVRLQDGREFQAVDVKTDPETDLAVLRIEGADDLVPAKVGDSDHVEIGDWVLALGQPFGLEGSVTAGIISAKGRGVGLAERENFLQTDAAINPGNSGGPLVNLDGEVIGINTAISSRSGGNEGVGFAVPINLAKWVSDQLQAEGSVRRAFLGVGIQPVTHELAKKFGVETKKGVLVTQVQADSPAAAAGLQPGDVILRFNGKQVASPRQLQMLVERSEPGTSSKLAIVRDGKPMTLKAKCDTRQDVVQVAKSLNPSNGSFGMEVTPLTPEVAQKLGVEDAEGLVITAMEAEGKAAEAGLSRGDVIVEVNRKPVSTVDDFHKALNGSEEGDLLLVRTPRGSRFVVIG